MWAHVLVRVYNPRDLEGLGIQHQWHLRSTNMKVNRKDSRQAAGEVCENFKGGVIESVKEIIFVAEAALALLQTEKRVRDFGETVTVSNLCFTHCGFCGLCARRVGVI